MPPDSLIAASVGLDAFHESAGSPILRKLLTRALAPHTHGPGTRANPDWPSYAAPPTQTNPIWPLARVAEAAGWYRSTPGFGPEMVTCRCPAAVRPRVTAAQNDFTVGAAVVAWVVAAGRGERDGEGSGLAGASEATASGLAVRAAPGPVDAVPWFVPQAATTSSARTWKPPTRDVSRGRVAHGAGARD